MGNAEQGDGRGVVPQRFVFVLTGTGTDVLENELVEMKASAPETAFALMNARGQVFAAAQKRLIGVRTGFASDAKFWPLVPIANLPDHVVQNERFGGRIVDDMGERDAETARLERLMQRRKAGAGISHRSALAANGAKLLGGGK